MGYISQFLYMIFNMAKQITVPGFDFSFQGFAIASFMFVSGISFLKFFLWVKSDSGVKY